jgi:integrase/recombinase XerD
MLGKRAKILSDANMRALLDFAATTRHPLRNRVIVLLSVKAGLRAAEIANLRWHMVTDSAGTIGTAIALESRIQRKAAAERSRSIDTCATLLSPCKPSTSARALSSYPNAARR